MPSQGPRATKLSVLGLCCAALEQCYLTPLGGGGTVYNCQGQDALTIFEGEDFALCLGLWPGVVFDYLHYPIVQVI